MRKPVADAALREKFQKVADFGRAVLKRRGFTDAEIEVASRKPKSGKAKPRKAQKDR